MKILILNLIKKLLFENIDKDFTVEDINSYLSSNNVNVSNQTVANYMKYLIALGFNITISHDRYNKYFYRINDKEVKY